VFRFPEPVVIDAGRILRIGEPGEGGEIWTPKDYSFVSLARQGSAGKPKPLPLEYIEGKRAIEEFARLADEYCTFIENRAALDPEAFIHRAASILPQLYAAAPRLPIAEFEEDKLSYDQVNTHNALEITDSINEKLGSAAVYWEIFDPYEEKEPVTNTLGNDLASIYTDLKNNLVLYRQGTRLAVLSAVWDWRYQFAIHWGQHLTGALRAIHEILSDRGVD